MIIAFTLTMPGVGSWNGKWTGEGRLYCITKTFTGKKGTAKAEKLLAEKSWYYSWNDGWGASISAKHVDGQEAARMRKQSQGFYGYDWMVDSIIMYGKPLATHEIEDHVKAEAVNNVS